MAATLHPIDSTGRLLDASFRVEQYGDRQSVIMESRSGGQADGRGRRNSEYFPALSLLLSRLAETNAVLEDAFVDSSATRDLPVDDRRLHLQIAEYPVRLGAVGDIEALRMDLCRAQRPVGQRPGARGGNNHKRIRLVITPTSERIEDLGTHLAGDAETTSAGEPEAARAQRMLRPRRQGFVSSVPRRRAIEQYAVARVVEDLEEERWDVDDVGSYEPFDLLCHRGQDELRVEVKGTTGEGREVILTAGEVRHAVEHAHHVALAVVSEISIDDELICEGGEVRWFRPWSIDNEALTPVAYTYMLPS